MRDQSEYLDVVDEIYTDPTPLIDIVKMQIGLWEKVVVLNATTLALSFTASGFFRAGLVGDGGIGYLAAAWKLLFIGIALCLTAQLIAISGVSYISSHHYATRVLTLLNKIATQKAATGEPSDIGHETISQLIISDSPKLSARANYLSRIAGGMGSAGLISSISAFYWLYRFAHLNVMTTSH